MNAKKARICSKFQGLTHIFDYITSKWSYGFSQFLHYLCLHSQGIHCWHSYWATMFEWPRKSSQLSVRKVLMILSYKLLKFPDYSCFRGQGIHCWYFYRATLFELPRKSRSTSGSRVPQRYWWLYLMDFHNILTIYVFEVKESIADILTELRCLSDLDYPSQLPVWEVLVLVILSYKFLKFLLYSCCWGQGINPLMIFLYSYHV